jgi:DNA-binding NarL/FixJ family response regulator
MAMKHKGREGLEMSSQRSTLREIKTGKKKFGLLGPYDFRGQGHIRSPERLNCLPDRALRGDFDGFSDAGHQRLSENDGNAEWQITCLERDSRTAPIRVLIAGDYAFFREGLRLFLAQQEGIQVVGEAADGLQTLCIAEALQPDVLLLGVQMPEVGRLEILANLRAMSPRTNVLIISGVLEDAFIVEALQQGAMGYLLKTATHSDLANAIRTTYAGELWAPRKVLTQVLEHMRQKIRELQGPLLELRETLTDREGEIVKWVMQGMTNKEIATQLSISEKTVKAHLCNIFRKLKVSRRAQLFRASVTFPLA